MKKLLRAIMVVAVIATSSCTNMFRDELYEIQTEIDDIKARLDELCQAMNTNISSLQTIVDAVQKND